jgi:hypothetical protein
MLVNNTKDITNKKKRKTKIRKSITNIIKIPDTTESKHKQIMYPQKRSDILFVVVLLQLMVFVTKTKQN